MAFRIKITVLFFYLVSSMNAQETTLKSIDNEYDNFRKLLIEEIEKTKDNPSDKKREYRSPAVLPAWFFDLPESTNHMLYAIGISDPGMEKDAAIELATLRAKSLMILMNNSEIKILTDHFTDEKGNKKNQEFATRFSNLFQFSATSLFDSTNFKITEKHFTSFNEGIVLAQYQAKKDFTDSLNVSALVFQLERQKQNVFKNEEKYQISLLFAGCNRNKNYNFTLHSADRVFEITSIHNNHSIKTTHYYFRYTADHSPLRAAQKANCNSKLNYGLWKSFVEVFLQEMYFISKNPVFEIKQVGDTFTNTSKKLLRETVIKIQSVAIENIRAKDNYLSLQLKIIK